MENITSKHEGRFHHLKNIYDKNKNQILIAIGLVLTLVFVSWYLVFERSSIGIIEFREIMNEGISSLDESKNLKEKLLLTQISEADFQEKSKLLQDKVNKINSRLHESKFKKEIKIEETTIESAGDALVGIVSLVFEGNDLKNTEDEILALRIILEDMKAVAEIE